MAGNTFGRILRLTTFGESHGAAVGGILDGCPAGIPLTEEDIQTDLDLRKPGSGPSATARKEPDRIKVLSGLFEGKTTGTPIAFMVVNEDARSRDYGNLSSVFRPGHADWSYFRKYNGIRDYRGGGRSSGRETLSRVAAGAIAKKILYAHARTMIRGACVELGGIGANPDGMDLAGASGRPYFAAEPSVIPAWDAAVREARSAGDTLGGIALVEASPVPAGLGEPVFDKLDALLAYAFMGVGAVKGVEIGSGFECVSMRGSSHNDQMLPPEQPGQGWQPRFGGNNAGGILGGISTGQPIVIRAAVKPIASIAKAQTTIDTSGNPAEVLIGGRHDLSAIPRVVPVLVAMAALVLADALLLQKRMELPA